MAHSWCNPSIPVSCGSLATLFLSPNTWLPPGRWNFLGLPFRRAGVAHRSEHRGWLPDDLVRPGRQDFRGFWAARFRPGVCLSPDGTKAAARDAAQPARGDIWLLDFGRGLRTRLHLPAKSGIVSCLVAGAIRIAFAAGNLLDTIYEKSASGAGEEKELYKKPGEIKIPTSWSRDGRFLLFSTTAVPGTRDDIWVLSLESHKATLLLGTEFMERFPAFSPDGRWIAYQSDESGRLEVYVRPFVSSGLPWGWQMQISRDGVAATMPRWRADGKELVFVGPGSRVVAVDVNGSGPAFEAGTPHVLFSIPLAEGGDMSSDGKKFLVRVPPGQAQASTQAPITVVLNWQADLKK